MTGHTDGSVLDMTRSVSAALAVHRPSAAQPSDASPPTRRPARNQNSDQTRREYWERFQTPRRTVNSESSHLQVLLASPA